mgnify:CR=1 FL=1
MVMDTIQIRLSHGLIERVDDLVDSGIYANRSDVIRDAVRKMVLEKLEKLVGIIPNTGDSVQEIREIRKKLSKEKFDLDEINRLGE